MQLMFIRLADRNDVPAILAISNWAALNTAANFAIEPESLEDWLNSFDQTHQMYPWLVCERKCGGGSNSLDVVSGFAKASPHRSRCAYAWSAEVSVYVHPNHHNRGVGKALYSRLIPMLKAQGFITLIAGITTPNPASEKLHEGFGFKRVGAFHKVGWKFGKWHDVGYWQLALRNGDAAPPAIQTVRE